MTDESFLRVDALTKNYGASQVVKGVGFGFARGEFISLLGPSGCGKTTILRMIAGFETPTSGTIHVDGHDITHLRPNQRRLGMVFQAYALFPNLTVADNIAFGLKVAGMGRDERHARVADMLQLIGLPGYAKRYPYEMSGGQQQRVALARALAPRPRLLLLDEPLSALDAKIRISLRQEIRAIQREMGITTLFVTHDQEEALSISDRIVVMNAGRIEQIGGPQEIYDQPTTPFAAAFIGQLNRLPALIMDARAGQVRVGDKQVTLPALPAHLPSGDSIALALRPEMMTLVQRPHQDVTLLGTIRDISFLGSVIRVHVDVAGTPLHIDTFNDRTAPLPGRGETVSVHLCGRDVLVLPQ
ncbi:ABC transporter ATP-binding protein [Devosia chinhatensis]|uniref:Spermidine/putrescine ABC transporter ATP-binding protein n=1 Tax=Devosia chinhatensis TaxID=429727 RepID=A0A0F5FES2_9HYPH|nr:ATP-binding cassette domain-containing protein [Devosia chinhatensis]KKB07298.1 spermidine/putrescine ABC transporter ATP-binding protein [Devosia chinhatensis]